ncbi:MAG: universal stress protein [Halioglobus sp.]|nr:universal stress protein [Halioglobus sp.]
MIIKCPTCGAHVPASSAVEVPVGDRYEQYCSLRCADAVGLQPSQGLPVAPQRILVAVDGSGPSLRATKYAAALAAATGGSVELIHAIDPGMMRALPLEDNAHPSEAAGEAAGELDKRLQLEARTLLQHCQSLCEAAAVNAEVTIDSKSPQQAIVDAASRSDLIVLGSRGLDATAAEMLGSLAERVIAQVTTPVLVVH